MHSSMARSEGMGWGGWLAVMLAVVIVAGATGLVIYGGTVQPRQHQVEQVLPNDRFPS
jgi:hypothetical protein